MKKNLLVIAPMMFIPAVSMAGFWRGFGTGFLSGAITNNLVAHMRQDSYCHPHHVHVVREPQVVEIRRTVHEVVPTSIQREIHELQVENADLFAENSQLRSTNAKLKAENTRLSTLNEELRNTVQTEQAVAAKQQRELRHTIRSLEHEIERLESKNNTSAKPNAHDSQVDFTLLK